MPKQEITLTDGSPVTPDHRINAFPKTMRMSLGMLVGDIAEKQWQWVEDMGWHNKRPLEYVALICSEIGEVANECRGEAPSERLGEELADIVLRTLDMAHHYGIDIESAIQKKMDLNNARGTRGRVK